MSRNILFFPLVDCLALGKVLAGLERSGLLALSLGHVLLEPSAQPHRFVVSLNFIA